MNCPNYPDHKLLHTFGSFETGVVAPDGGKEYQYAEGFYCDYCNYTYDASDLSDENEIEQQGATTNEHE